ncbi:MAG: hypothetical protein JHC35_06550 [Sulfuricurvum sp.]|uniref:hypothetical protein n=1 Tax=Sulfuricurvum sp. TaxID=2025608 RepID=UPI0025FF9D5F|nr:hypothetical protein [Sulfuricurvum sp.]MCI4406926.1 hypothetical protein [Sulfuricurvum sp.]
MWKANPNLKILYIDLDAVVPSDTKEPLSHNTNFYTFDICDDLVQFQYQNHINDTVYLGLLREHLRVSIESIKPDIIFYRARQNGSNDTSRSTSLTPNGMKERDLFIFSEAKKGSIPIMMNIDNGYDQENYHQLVERIEAIIEIMGE